MSSLVLNACVNTDCMRLFEVASTFANSGRDGSGIICMPSKHFAKGWHPLFHRVRIDINQAAKSEYSRVKIANGLVIAWVFAIWYFGAFDSAYESILNRTMSNGSGIE